MTHGIRRPLTICLGLSVLSACAHQPETPAIETHEALAVAAPAPANAYHSPAGAPIEVRAEKIGGDYSSINAQVLRDATVVNSTFVAALDPDVPVTRLESSWTQKRSSDEGWRIGDTISSAGTWGSSVRFGGVQFGSGNTIADNVITAPTLGSAGMAVLPTAADAFLSAAGASDATFARKQLSIDGDVNIVGPNTVNFIARDQLGRAQTVSAPLIAPIQLASTGCNQYSFGFGRVREDYGVVSNEYGPAFANSTVVCGVPLGFTVEGHGEYLSEGVTAFGVGVTRRLGPLGVASFGVASSKAEELGTGWLARFGFDHENSLFNLMVRTRMQSREFREVGTALVEDPLMERGLASLGVKVRDNSSLAVTYATQTTWSREQVNLIALSQSMQVGRTALSMSAGHSLVDETASSVFISFTRPFGYYVPSASSSIEALERSLLNSVN